MILLSSFIFGLIFGSFLNVVIYRLNPGHLRRPGFISPRSFCPNCKTNLKWYDLVPVLSFFYLLGRCRYCHKKISWQYPIVEILSGLIWVGVFYQNFSAIGRSAFGGQFMNIFYQIFILSSLIVIAVYDYHRQIIPDKIVYPAIGIVLIYNIFNSNFISSFIIASVVFLFFFSIHFFSKGRAMGLGDAKLGFLIGLFLNPLSAATALALAFIIGAVFGIILIWLGKYALNSQIAFGPFLVLGTIIAFFISKFFNINLIF